jgi:hypothetical protein
MKQYVDARVESSIYNETLTRLDCNNEQVVKWNETSNQWYCSDISAPGAGDIDAVNTDNTYITGGQTSGTVNLAFNETVLNTTIDSKITTYNQSITSWAISAFANISNLLNYYTKSEIDDINDSINNSMFAMNVSINNYINETNTSMKNYVDSQITENEYNDSWIYNNYYNKTQSDLNLTNLNTTIIQILNNGSYLN